MFRIPNCYESHIALQRWCSRNAALCLQSDDPETMLAEKVKRMLRGLDTDPSFVLSNAYTQARISEVTAGHPNEFEKIAAEVLATAADVRYMLRYPPLGSLRQKGLVFDDQRIIFYTSN